MELGALVSFTALAEDMAKTSIDVTLAAVGNAAAIVGNDPANVVKGRLSGSDQMSGNTDGVQQMGSQKVILAPDNRLFHESDGLVAQVGDDMAGKTRTEDFIAPDYMNAEYKRIAPVMGGDEAGWTPDNCSSNPYAPSSSSNASFSNEFDERVAPNALEAARRHLGWVEGEYYPHN